MEETSTGEHEAQKQTMTRMEQHMKQRTMVLTWQGMNKARQQNSNS